MTPEPGSWLDPDPLRPDEESMSPEHVRRLQDVLGVTMRSGVTGPNFTGKTWTYTPSASSRRRRSVVIPLILVAAVVAGLIVFVVTR